MIKFSELSVPVKIGVISGYLFLVLASLSFIVGFIGGSA
jgi:hypothetical protein